MRTPKAFKELGMKSTGYTSECLAGPKNTSVTTSSLTEMEELALRCLRSSEEGMIDDTWGSVYLDNAKPGSWTGKTWSGVLSSLSQKGYYQEDSDGFGMVRMS